MKRTVHLIDMNHVILIGLLSFLMLLAGQAHAEVYKWKDADGNVQYTQHPPSDNSNAEIMNLSTGSGTPVPQDTPSAVENPKGEEKTQDSGQQAPQRAEPTAEEKAELKRKCDNVRARLQSLQRPRVSTVDEQGNRVRLSEDERQAQIEETTRLLEEHCD